MAGKAEQLSPSEETEQIVRDYFEAHSGWTVTKLDSGKERAADFRICLNDSSCFLCEVKTIKSVRANFPYTPEHYFLERREKRRQEIEDWKKQNLDGQLIMPQGEWQFIYGDESEFREKYRRRARNTEVWFKEFAETMRNRFFNSSISHLPYSLRLDSDDLYIPTPREQDTFFQWLEKEIIAIDMGKPSWHRRIQRQGAGRVSFYSAFYQIHKPRNEDDFSSEYQLSVTGPLQTGPLEIDIHYYGMLNLDSIDSNVYKGLQQLTSSALREEDQQTPHVIALAFESGIGFEWNQLSNHIAWLLQKNPALSAIAVLRWTPDGIPPPAEEGFLAWSKFMTTTPTVPTFVVYHNSWLCDVKPLPVEAFGDKWSVQFCPVRSAFR